MLVPCSLCKSKISNISALNVHFKYCHTSVTTYSCGIDKCSRKFDLWNSYRKHLISVHNVPVHSLNDHEMVVEVEPPASPVCNSNENIAFEQPVFSSKDFSLSDFESSIKDAVSRLVARFSSFPGLPRCFVDTIIKTVTNFLNDKFMLIFQNFVLESVTEEDKSEAKGAFDLLMNPFEHVKSEYLRFKYFEQCGDYIPPESYIICNRVERVSNQQGVKQVMKSVTGQYIPLRKVLKKFMELPDVLNKSLEYVKSLEDDTMVSNLMQCSVWKRKRAKFPPDAIVFPVNPYYDDYEPNNPLGPHCEKLGAVYLQLPFLPPECQSKLENILLALLFNADDRASYGNEAVFKPLIKELTKLEEDGIWINTPEGEQRIYFVVGVLLGDNLGLNGMCGFVESFTAHHPCRICKAHIDDLRFMYEEDPTVLRTPENYLQDVKENDSSNTGVKEQCVFDSIPSFETPTDISVDSFHDCDEGVCHYVMVAVVLHFHRLLPDFVETLNQRLYMTDLGVDSDNRPPSIDIDKLKKSNKFKMTGAEMITFVRIFGTLVVDLVPENDSYYHMYLLLHDVVSLSHVKIISKECSVILDTRVKELNRLYVHLTGEWLKFKFHLLNHYGRLTKLYGPIGCLCTIRMEAKHKFLKAISNVCVCRKNLPCTVCIKHQLNFCYRFICNDSIIPPFLIGPGEIINLTQLDQFKYFKKSLPKPVVDEEFMFCPRWVDYKGTRYSLKDVLLTNYSSENGCPVFAQIEIIVPYDDSPHFICSPLCTVGYYSEVRGYEVERVPGISDCWYCVKQENLVDYIPHTIIPTGKGELVITLKSFL